MPKGGRFNLPDRWSKYRAVGDVIPGTRFIAFKVPLMLQYFDGKDIKGEKFTTTQLRQQIGKKLRLVIDLSNKGIGKYYNPQDLERNGIHYQKLSVVGHQVPSEQVIKRFRHIVQEFEKKNPSDSFIGVHCTHGVNRTGYVISRYMIEYLSKTTEEALKAFEVGRGYPLERKNYIEALQDFEKTRSGNSWNQSQRKNANSRKSRNQTRQDDYDHCNWNGYSNMSRNQTRQDDYDPNNWNDPSCYGAESHYDSYDSEYQAASNEEQQYYESTPFYCTPKGTHQYPGPHRSNYTWRRRDHQQTEPAQSFHKPGTHNYFY